MPNWKQILKGYVDSLETALGNLTGDMSDVTQSEAASLAAFVLNYRASSRIHNQARICLIVPDLANLASDLPNTAIKAELEKIGSVTALDEAGVDDGQEDWGVYDLIVIGSNTYAAFTDANLDDMITVKIPVMVCNRDVAMHLKMGGTQTQSTSDVNEYCETIHNRVMYLVFGSVGDKAIFSEAAQSDRLDMSDAQLTEQILMVDTTADGNTKAVIGWLPIESPVGVLNELSDGSEIPAGRLFTGCFVNADKLTALGQLLLRRIARNLTEASITPSISLKAAASQVAAILVDTADMQPKLGTPAADISADILAIKGVVDAIQTNQGRMLFSMDFWSDLQEEVVVTGAQTTPTLPSVVIADLPAGATIVRAIGIFKFRMVENTFAGVNKLDAAAALPIQVKETSAGSFTTAIDFVDDAFTLADTAREGGDVIIGDNDIAGEVDANDTYDFQWLNAKADQNNILFNDVQVGLRILYSV